MSSAKKVIAETTAPKRPARHREVDLQAEQIVRSRESWEPLIEQFAGQKFPSLSDAADRLGEALIARMGWESTDELQQFVALILETDPYSEAALSRLVKTK